MAVILRKKSMEKYEISKKEAGAWRLKWPHKHALSA
jgi:hypothetical protein